MNEINTRRRGLGRGLEALLGGDGYAAAPADAGANPNRESGPPDRDPAAGARRLPIGDIRPGRFQPRRIFDDEELQALAASIREKGVLQPVLVRRRADAAPGWELIAGERRWLAAQRAGLADVPAVVLDLSDREALEAGIVENVQRQDLTPLEEAGGYRRLIDEFGYTQEALSRIVGRSRSHVANTLRLLNLTGEVRRLVDARALSAGHARALLTAADPDALAAKIVRNGLSVRQAERLAGKGGAGRSGRSAGAGQAGGADSEPAAGKDADTLALERTLEDRLGLKVAIDHKGAGGRVTIRYASLEQLDDLLTRLVAD